MKGLKFYAGDALKWVCENLSSVSKNVFAVHRPEAQGEQMKSFLVAQIGSDMVDQGAYQKCTLRIDIIVKDKQTVISDVAELQRLCDGICALLPLKNERYSMFNPRLVLKGNDNEGFTLWVLYTTLVVNTTDRLST